MNIGSADERDIKAGRRQPNGPTVSHITMRVLDEQKLHGRHPDALNHRSMTAT